MQLHSLKMEVDIPSLSCESVCSYVKKDYLQLYTYILHVPKCICMGAHANTPVTYSIFGSSSLQLIV